MINKRLFIFSLLLGLKFISFAMDPSFDFRARVAVSLNHFGDIIEDEPNNSKKIKETSIDNCNLDDFGRPIFQGRPSDSKLNHFGEPIDEAI